ncbi:hypothetical protein N9V90_02080, partial [Endozoicomonas sp.]|nr:hypothetical protein [Endozoicomonas sp.]
MINMGRPVAFPPLLLNRGLQEILFSGRPVQAGGQFRYIALGERHSDERVYDRQLYSTPTPQLYMTDHSPQVSALLWKITRLNDRYQKNRALIGYLNAVSAWRQDLPELSAYAKGKAASFMPVEYDIVSQPLGVQQPVSIFNHPCGHEIYWQYIRKYADSSSVSPSEIAPYQAMATLHHHYLAHQLHEQEQQLTFHGMLYQAECLRLPAAYRLSDVVAHGRWLQAPERQPLPLLATHHNVQHANEAELFLIPANDRKQTRDIPTTTAKLSREASNRYGPAFSQCFHRFPQPVPTKDMMTHRQAGIDTRAPLDVKRRESYTMRRSPVKHVSVKQKKTPTAEPSQHVSKVQRRLPQKIRTLTEGIQCLEGKFWSRSGDKQPDSRERLDQLFDNGPCLFENHPYPIDKRRALRFISLFRQALQRERKQSGQRETVDQRHKKAERLKALDAIRDYVTTTSSQDKNKLRFAIQLCGRVRERSLVRQLSQKYCGGFAILQALWEKYPLRAVQISLSLIQRGVARVSNPRGGSHVLRVPVDCSVGILARYPEALADILPLCTLYNCTRFQPATVKRDAVNATRLGLEPMLYRAKVFSRFISLFEKKQNHQFLAALCRASQAGVPIRGSIGPVFADYLEKRLLPLKRVR